MSLMDRISAAHEARGRLRIEVPEWAGEDGAPCVLYARPYTLADERAIMRDIKDDNPDGFASLVVRKLQYEDGTPAFSLADKPRLLRAADALLIKRLAAQIMAGPPHQPRSLEEAEKKSPGTGS